MIGLDAKDWIVVIAITAGFFAAMLTYIFSYRQGHEDGRRNAEDFYRIMLGNDIWLWVNGRFYPYEITEEELRDLVVTDRIHGGSFKWPTK